MPPWLAPPTPASGSGVEDNLGTERVNRRFLLKIGVVSPDSSHTLRMRMSSPLESFPSFGVNFSDLYTFNRNSTNCGRVVHPVFLPGIEFRKVKLKKSLCFVFNRLVVIRVQAGKYSASPDNKNTYEASFAKRMILHTRNWE